MIPLLLACTATKDPAESTPGETDPLESGEVDTVDTVDTVGDDTETAESDSGDTETGDTDTDTGDPPPSGLGLPSLAGYSLVYIHVDTLRRDHLALYGYGRDTLPNVGSLPWRVVSGSYADGSWTMPSTSSLLTGNPQDIHGLTDDGGDPGTKFLQLQTGTIAGHLAEQGWATALYSGNSWVTDLTDMSAEFDFVQNIIKFPDYYNLLRSAEFATGWIADVPADQPFFLFLQPMDMHLPYQVQPAEQGTWGSADRPWNLLEADQTTQIRDIQRALKEDRAGALQALYDTYDESMLGLDLGLAEVFAALDQAGRRDSTVVVLSADHGETLDDDLSGEVSHGHTLRQELLRNPLLVLIPGDSGGTATCPMQNMDVFPTLLDAWGLPPLPEATGVSRQQACGDIAVSTLWSLPEEIDRMVATDGVEKIEVVCDGSGELGYDLVSDPSELSPEAVGKLTRADALRTAIDDTLTRILERYPKVSCPR